MALQYKSKYTTQFIVQLENMMKKQQRDVGNCSGLS